MDAVIYLWPEVQDALRPRDPFFEARVVLLLCDSVEESVGYELDFLDALVVAAELERVGRTSTADEKCD